MPTREIYGNEWKVFFEGFSSYHKGWTIRMEVFSQEFGAQEPAQEASFEGIVAELKDGRKASIEVILGATAENHITHTISEPTHVRLESDGETEVLQIESADRNTFLLSFHQAAPLVKTHHGALEKTA
jgi:hypothetical protein